MPCKDFEIADNVRKLKGITPTSLSGNPATIVASKIKSGLAGARDDIKSQVTNSVDNFKKIVTGALPALKLPEINPAAFFSKIDKTVNSSLQSFTRTLDKLRTFGDREKQLLDDLINCIESNETISEEVAAVQGNIFADIIENVAATSNNDIRDFNINPAVQEAKVEETTKKVLAQAETRSIKGVTNNALVVKQNNNLRKLFKN
jgi:hypothetical protein